MLVLDHIIPQQHAKQPMHMLLLQCIMHWQMCCTDLQDSSAEWQPGKQFDARKVIAENDGIDDEEGDSSQPEAPIERPSGVKVHVLLAADVEDAL